MTLKDKIAASIGGLAIIGVSLLPQLVSNEVTIINEFTGLPNWPPTGLRDLNNDKEPDLAIDYLIGLGPFPYLKTRQPTQAEIDWYISQSD